MLHEEAIREVHLDDVDAQSRVEADLDYELEKEELEEELYNSYAYNMAEAFARCWVRCGREEFLVRR